MIMGGDATGLTAFYEWDTCLTFSDIPEGPRHAAATRVYSLVGAGMRTPQLFVAAQVGEAHRGNRCCSQQLLRRLLGSLSFVSIVCSYDRVT